MFNPFTMNPFQQRGMENQTLDEFLMNPTPLGPMAGSSPMSPGPIGFDTGYGLSGNTMRFNPGAQLDPSQVNLWLGNRNPWNGWLDDIPPGGRLLPFPSYYDALPTRYVQSNPFSGGMWGGSWNQPIGPGYPWGPQWEQDFPMLEP